MKTPREILLACHRAAEPKLDAIRRAVVAEELNNQETKEQSLVLRFVALFLRCSNTLWRELVLPSRRVWAELAAGPPEPVRRLTPAMAVREWCHDVIWPCRHVWAGLAAVWVLILAGNVSLHEHSPTLAGKSSPPSPGMITAFKDQQKILAELLADHSAPRAADRPKFFSPKPRTESAEVMMV